MDHLQQLRRRVRQYLFGAFLLENAVLLGLWYYGITNPGPTPEALLAITGIVSLVLVSCLTYLSSNVVLQPLQAIWQAILHLSPSQQGVAAPKLDDLHLGRKLVANLTTQLYQLVDVAQQAATTDSKKSEDLKYNFIAQNLPLPLFVLDADATIRYANEAAGQYIGTPAAELLGKNVYMILDMSFPSEDTLDKWLKDVKQRSATATTSWERVRLNVRDNHPTLLFDLAAYYNRDNAEQLETMLVLFDHTKQYSQDDQAVSFVALTVHELRTPLTMLRGYIEVIEEELSDTVDPELKDFILKMRTMAEQLVIFVNNILNVARVDNDQFEVHLQEGDWQDILTSSVDAIRLRAKVRGIELECTIAPDLPPVGVDRLSISEVISNLLDNAIKYSGTSKVIKIETHKTADGLVETTVQDTGVGISQSILPNLFTKFYRDHRNRAQIGGTGLGLYLSKAIVTAHGGNLWVRSKEGQGSTFGFTLLPYAQLTEDLKTGNQEIVKGAHGWIKNHSLYRR
jgi:PAS domain S-box-containing protein